MLICLPYTNLYNLSGRSLLGRLHIRLLDWIRQACLGSIGIGCSILKAVGMRAEGLGIGWLCHRGMALLTVGSMALFLLSNSLSTLLLSPLLIRMCFKL